MHRQKKWPPLYIVLCSVYFSYKKTPKIENREEIQKSTLAGAHIIAEQRALPT
jgi:hypothetical protein